MEFKISSHIIARRKRTPYFILIYFAFIAGLLSILDNDNNIDWTTTIAILSVAAIIFTRTSYMGTQDYIKYTNIHRILILPKGFVFCEGELEALIEWGKIIKVSIKSNSKGIKKVILKIRSSDEVDLSRLDLSHYENLDELNIELKKYLDPQLWN